MMKLFNFRNLFRRPKQRSQREIAPQFTRFERQAMALGALPPGALPNTTYEQMERDAMVQTALTIKRLSVLAAPWRILPADGSPEAHTRSRFVEEAFERMAGSPGTILDQAMLAFSRGWSVQELVFEVGDRRVWLSAVRQKDPGRFSPSADEFGRIEGLILRLPGEVERSLPRGRFVIFTHRASLGHPKGRSDLDAAYPHWEAKSKLLMGWRLHLNRFASPTLVGRFQVGYPVEDQAKLHSDLETLDERKSIVVPDQVEISAIGGSKESSTGFMEAIEFHNREMARSILGQTLTTDEGRRVGSLALGKVHLQVLLLQIAALRRELADTVMTEQVIRPLVELNFGPGLLPKFEFEETPLEAFTRGALS